MQPSCTPFPIRNQSVVPCPSSNCCFLTYIQVSQEAGQVVWYVHLFQNFPQFIVIHTGKGLGIVNKAEINVFLELSCFFDDAADVSNLISGSSAFSKTSLNIWKFTVHVLLKPGLENFKHYFTSVWDECNCAVVWAFIKLRYRQKLRPTLLGSKSSTLASFSRFLGQYHISDFQFSLCWKKCVAFSVFQHTDTHVGALTCEVMITSCLTTLL